MPLRGLVARKKKYDSTLKIMTYQKPLTEKALFRKKIINTRTIMEKFVIWYTICRTWLNGAEGFCRKSNGSGRTQSISDDTDEQIIKIIELDKVVQFACFDFAADVNIANALELFGGYAK